jgi:hypothetical protein
VLAALLVAAAAGAVLVLTGRDRVSTSTGPAALLALAGFAFATVAALIVLNRGLHPGAAAGVWAVAAAWPLGGLWLAIPAVLVIAAIARASGGRDLYGPPAIAAALLALACLATATATARVHDNPRPTSERGQTPSLTPAPSSERGQAPSLTPAPTSERGQAPSLTPADEKVQPRRRTETAPAGSVGGLAPSLTPEAVVRAYYADLDAKRFEAAWARLSPAVRESFGGFDGWRAGFATTVASTPEELAAEGGMVRLVLVARDRCAGGEMTRRFAVQWRLERTATGWRAAALTAAALPSEIGGCVSR